ncbi:hypothetical protein PR048_011485 [Dryococelus australis]|uniref:Uncharacterized protein n=1 Tax=Dryococelus australis TaxID=614101 RepID=A0ABQ9HLQ6_9NEOP|nr:hypothetical protein PR048_011485 [Dryococelus australis]
MARRGANEIASCVCRAILNLPEEIKHIVLYSDSCLGQNKNTPCLAIDHAVIEKAKKKYSTQINNPHDCVQLIRMVGKKKPFNVIEESNEDGEKCVWEQVRWLRCILDKPTKVLYKTSLKEEDTFSVMDMTRGQQPHPCLKPNKCYTDVVPISEKKKKDLLSLLPYIPPAFHEFYKWI